MGIGVGLANVPSIALAHGVELQSRTISAVEVQANYDSGEPMTGAQVQVYAPATDDSPTFMGVTNESGQYTFVPDQAGNWRISVGQAGHGKLTVIPIAESGAIAADLAQSTGLTALQRVIVAGAVAWGCVGTALYFWRGKR